MSDNAAFQIDYDEYADVLYITSKNDVATKGNEDDSGIVWRYDRDGILISATVLDFVDRWHKDQRLLVTTISDHFRIPLLQAETVLDGAWRLAPRH